MHDEVPLPEETKMPVTGPGSRFQVECQVSQEIRAISNPQFRLFDTHGKKVGETHLRLEGNRILGEYLVPEKVPDGVYKAVVLSGRKVFRCWTLIVLSPQTRARLDTAASGDEDRMKAYELASDEKLDLATKQLEEAERKFDQAKWAPFAAETLLQRAHLLGRAGRMEERAQVLATSIVRLNQAGLATREMSAYSDAALWFRKAADVAVQLEDKKNAAINTHDLGEVQIYLGEYGGALTSLNTALEWSQEIADKRIEAYVRNSLGVLQSVTRKFEQAIQDFDAAHQLFQELNDVKRAESAHVSAAKLREFLGSEHGPLVEVGPLPISTELADVLPKIRSFAEEQGVVLTIGSFRSLPRVLIPQTELTKRLQEIMSATLRIAVRPVRFRVLAKRQVIERRPGMKLSFIPVGPGGRRAGHGDQLERRLPSELRSAEKALAKYGGLLSASTAMGSRRQTGFSLWLPCIPVEEK
jgi:tetratricopeptide (TPR) repeat protein